MGTLTAALSWAERGFPVFPLRENEKEPAIDNWDDVATRDAETIRRLWTDPVLRTEHNYNIGVKCNDFVVIDIDVKHGKTGYDDYAQLQGHYDTLVVQTPTGGFHCYFHGPDSSNASLTNSIDVRSHNGYVVAPGSVINGVPYKVINDREMVFVPSSIKNMLQAPMLRSQVEANVERDNPASVEAGRKFLESAPPAIQGQRGDETTFITAARLVREMALSVPAAFMLMRDHWNNKCVPPWPLEDLWAKIQNAAQYGTAELGRLSPEVLFEGIVIPEPPTVLEQTGVGWGNAISPTRIQPRPWLVERMLMKRAISLLLASGSSGKSSLSLALAAHLAIGKDFAGFRVLQKCKTIVYNGEDDLEEQSRRLLATCTAYGLDFNEVKSNIMLLSREEMQMDLVVQEGRRVARNEVLVQTLIKTAEANDVGLLVLDPLVKIHKCDEGDNVQMDFVMETLSHIAAKANVSVLALHHTSKSSSKTEDKQGNMDVSRGASAIVNAARIAFTMYNASATDAEEYGLFSLEERMKWVRLDDAKMNLSLASSEATWFHKEGLRIPSGDIVGVLKFGNLTRSREHVNSAVAGIIVAHMRANQIAALTMPLVTPMLRSQFTIWGSKTDTEIRRELESMYSTPYITHDGGTLSFVRKKEGGKNGVEQITMVLS